MKNYKIKALLLIAIPSITIGYFVDLLLNNNDCSFLISGLLPIIMVSIYHPFLLTKDSNNPNQHQKRRFGKWRHTLFSFIIFLFLARIFFGLFSVVLGVSLNGLQNDSNLFIMLSITTIVIGTWGDQLTHALYKECDLEDALISRNDFFQQDYIKIFVYFFYLMLIFITNIGFKSEFTQLGINTFATFVAFERLWKFVREKKMRLT